MNVNDAINGEQLLTSTGREICTITGLPHQPTLTVGMHVRVLIPNGDGTFLELTPEGPRTRDTTETPDKPTSTWPAFEDVATYPGNPYGR